jgi:solute carrier family 25 S-adenosylmethionine transporter 26
VQGVYGLYTGYAATLMRNIPSAVIRFAVYEEVKMFLQTHKFNVDCKVNDLRNASLSSFAELRKGAGGLDMHVYIPTLAGALAGAVSSALTTPFDVIKTKVILFLVH